MRSRKLLSALLILTLALGAGCGATKRKWDKGTMWGAFAGLVVGGGAGVGVAAAVDDNRGSKLARGGAIGAASGALVGGLVGHYFFDPPMEIAAPIPVPPPAPEPMEPTVLEPLDAGEVLAVVREEAEPKEVKGFGFDSDALPSNARADLDAVAARIAAAGPVDIIVEGHTDSIGAESYNYELGRRRAQTVARYLTGVGVLASSIAVASAGESAPIASNASESGRRQNRRVEIRVADEVPVQRIDPDPMELEEGMLDAEELPSPPPSPTSLPAGVDHLVYFAQDSFDVAEAEQPIIGAIASALRADPALTAEVTGHMDPSEDDPALSSLRAARVRLELINQGIALDRIQTRAARADEPAGTEPSANRRAEIRFR